jgi:hypothetical protein
MCSVPTDPSSKAAYLKGSTIMRKISCALAAVSFVLTGLVFGGTAFAEDKAKVKVYDFSGDTIEGDLVKPEGSDLNARDFAKHSSLIRIRKDFIPEIIKSAEDL